MHQITVIEPKWLSEVAPTFFRVADQNKISKRKASEKIEPLFDRFAADKDDWVSFQPFVGPKVTFSAEIEQAEAGNSLIADVRVIIFPHQCKAYDLVSFVVYDLRTSRHACLRFRTVMAIDSTASFFSSSLPSDMRQG